MKKSKVIIEIEGDNRWWRDFPYAKINILKMTNLLKHKSIQCKPIELTMSSLFPWKHKRHQAIQNNNQCWGTAIDECELSCRAILTAKQSNSIMRQCGIGTTSKTKTYAEEWNNFFVYANQPQINHRKNLTCKSEIIRTQNRLKNWKYSKKGLFEQDSSFSR